MPTVESNGKIYEVCEDGFLKNFDDWDDGWVNYVMQSEKISKLTDEQQKLIKGIRDYYSKNRCPPVPRILQAVSGVSRKRAWELFPMGIKRGAYKIAGVPRPCG